MPVDISDRVREIIAILSFLRVFRSDLKKPGHCVGLFRSVSRLMWELFDFRVTSDTISLRN